MIRQSAVSLRPTRFSQLVGQESAVSVIRNTYEKQEPSAWMFWGPTGTGKTTVARILANSLQCTHGELGEPCDDCIQDNSAFAIEEINASENTGVEEIAQKAEASNYAPNGCRRRVLILDEAQKMSSSSQNLLLKYFEDAPETTVWMVCTTEQSKVIETLQRRCKKVELRPLQAAAIGLMVKKGAGFLSKQKVELRPLKPLLESLLEAKIQSPALILNAVDNYLVSRTSPEDSVKGLGETSDTKAICIAVMAGDWDVVKREIKEATPDDLRGIRANVAGYLRGALIKSFPGPRSDEMAKAINRVAQLDSIRGVTQGPATVGVLYELCQLFKGAPETGDDGGEMRKDGF